MNRFQQIHSLLAIILYIVYSVISISLFTVASLLFFIGIGEPAGSLAILNVLLGSIGFYTIVGILFVVPVIIPWFRYGRKITFSYPILLVLLIIQLLLLLSMWLNLGLVLPSITPSLPSNYDITLYEIGVLHFIGTFIFYGYPLLFIIFLYRTLRLSGRLKTLAISSQNIDQEYNRAAVADRKSILAVFFILLVISLLAVVRSSTERAYSAAVFREDVGRCESLKGVNIISSCIQSVAIRTADPSVCNKILLHATSYKTWRDVCYVNVVRINKISDSSICDKIIWIDIAKKEECSLEVLRAGNNEEK